jgi:alpha-beta hydrolase superfamily lysophospholipase/phosphatidylglycerophosphate synthase
MSTPSTYLLKPKFQAGLQPLTQIASNYGITANQLTVTACTLSVGFGLLMIWRGPSRPLLLLLPIFLLLRMALNAMDGMVALEFRQQSNLGACLNELGDVISDAFLYLPFVYLPGFDSVWMVAVIVLAVIVEMAGTVTVMIGGSRRYDGPMGKSDRAFVFGALALWCGLGSPLVPWSAYLFPRLMTFLLVTTVINRVRRGLAETNTATTTEESLADVITTRIAEEHFFNTTDGTRLFYRYWPAASASANRAVMLFHRGHEHSGRLQHVVDELDLSDVAMFAWDARGHGRSLEDGGTDPTLGTLVKDVDEFVQHVTSAYGIATENIAVLGQSVGSVLLAAWVHDYAPKIRCMVLAAPAFKVKLYVPFARIVLQLLHRLIGNFYVNSYVKPSALTHDPLRIASYESDLLIRRPISVKILLALYSTADRVIADAQAIQLPTQLLISGADFVVHRKPQDEFFERLGSSVKERHVFAGFYHDTLGERDRVVAMEEARRFIVRMFARPPEVAPPLEADQAGYTKDEFDALSRPLPLLSCKSPLFAISKLAIRTGGRLSDGIRLGLETGFDSGSTLDYVYRNQASGITPLGKLIDWFYINSIGWRGIRVRKQNVEVLLMRAIETLRSKGQAVRILDIAAGQARYVFETIEKDGANVDDVLLRDYSQVNVQSGDLLIRQKGMQRFARFEQGDAFNRNEIASIRPRPTLGVVSGLYELFPENAIVRESLSGLAATIEPGGYLIYTGQPWHPQLEMIARTLTSHRDHQPWRMRRRTQAELDQLVEAAGFCKMDQLTDEWGIFTVSLAQRGAVK